MKHSSNVSIGENFELELPVEDVPVFLPMSVIGLRDVKLKVTLVNTLPFSLAIKDVSVPGEDNLVVSFDGGIEAGTPQSPSTCDLALHIVSKDGSLIPDITALDLTVKMSGSLDMEDVPLVVDQGLYLKQSSLVISGGITLFGNEN